MSENNPESIRHPAYWGMERSALNFDVLKDIMTMYFAIGRSPDYEREYLEEDAGAVLSGIEQWPQGDSFLDFRLGSRLTVHSKLSISRARDDMIRFSFDPNLTPGVVVWGTETEAETKAVAEGITDEFNDQVETYLYATGLAKPIYY